MSLCRRKLHDGGMWQFLGLMVRPLGPVTYPEHLPVLRQRPGGQFDGHRYVLAVRHRSP